MELDFPPPEYNELSDSTSEVKVKKGEKIITLVEDLADKLIKYNNIDRLQILYTSWCDEMRSHLRLMVFPQIYNSWFTQWENEKNRIKKDILNNISAQYSSKVLRL